MNIKFRNTIFFVTVFSIICFTLSNRAAMSQSGASISLSKEIYYLGEIVRINYSSIPGDRDERNSHVGIEYSIIVQSVEGRLDVRSFQGKETTSGVWEIPTEDIPGPWIARDFTVTLQRSENSGRTSVVTKYFRLRQPKYEPMPGVLSIRGSGRFSLGDPIVVDIQILPSVKISRIYDGLSGKVTVYDFHVELHRLNRKTHGKAIQPDQQVHTQIFLKDGSANPIIKSYTSEKVISAQGDGFLSPGIYELRLLRKNKNSDHSSNYSMHYVVDSARFEIVIESWSKSLKVALSDDFKVGEYIRVQIDGAAVPFKDFNSSPLNDRMELHLYEVLDDNSEITKVYQYDFMDDVKLSHVAKVENFSVDQDIAFNPIDRAGKYVMVLQTNFLSSPLYEDDYHLAFRGYILDQLEINVKRVKELAPSWSEREQEQFNMMKKQYPSFEIPLPVADPYIRTGTKYRFIPGERIPVEVFMPNDSMQEATTTVFLKTNDPDAGYDNGEPIGKQLKEWNIEAGKKKAWTIPGDLTIGSYNFVLKTKYVTEGDRKGYTGVSGVAGFQVIPEVNLVKIDMKSRKDYFYGEMIKFDIVFPKSLNSEKFKFNYNISREGGFIPGCAKVQNYRIGGETLENKSKNISFVTPPPGKYVLRVYGTLLDSHLQWNPILLAEELFTSDLRWQEGALSFLSSKTEFLQGEEIYVTVDANINTGMMSDLNNLKKINETGKYMLYLFRQGDVGYGGVYRFAKTGKGNAYIEKIVEPKDNFILKKEKNLLPGAYEFRLYNKWKDRDNSFLIARLPFYIIEPQSPFPTEKGKQSVPQPLDLESQVLFHNLMVGDFLDEDSCGGPFDIEPIKEKVELKFVRFENGKYVDIVEPIDFGAGFYVQGKLQEEALRESYIITLTTPEGDRQEVALFPLEDDPTIVRSDRVYLIWNSEAEVSE